MTNKYGKNLLWFLGELANADAEQIETGEIEIVGEGGSCECDVFELVGAAVERIGGLTKLLRDHNACPAPDDAEFFDTGWRQFLKEVDGELYVQESFGWVKSQHKDGAAMLQGPHVISLK